MQSFLVLYPLEQFTSVQKQGKGDQKCTISNQTFSIPLRQICTGINYSMRYKILEGGPILFCSK